MRNRHFQVKLVKDQPSDKTVVDHAATANTIETSTIEVLKEGAKLTAFMLVTAKVLDVAGKATLHIVKTKIK